MDASTERRGTVSNDASDTLARWRRIHLEPCQPASWARGGHLQTIIGHFVPSPILREDDGEEVIIDLPGGDRLVTHLYRGCRPTIVYLFHGLGGHSHGTYMMRTALSAMGLGATVLMANHRGCGKGVGMAAEPYHSGRADDLSAVIKRGREMFPDYHHVAIGFSLSANALLLLASGLGGAPLSDLAKATTSAAEVASAKAALPDAAIAVNAPIDLQSCARLLRRGFSRVYDVRFLNDMKKLLESKRKAGHTVKDIALSRWASLYDFDEVYTGPVAGFGTREKYYDLCSANRYLKNVKIPTYMMTAADDPFIDVSAYREAEISPNVIRHIEEHGGHLGYFSGSPTSYGTRRWLDYALWKLLNEVV